MLAVASLWLVVLWVPLVSAGSGTSVDAVAPASGGHAGHAAGGPGVTLTIRTADDRLQFRQGEIVTLELVFVATRADSSIAGAGTESIEIEPREGVTHPLADVSSAFGVVGGGPGSLVPPTEGPLAIRLDVNDQWRFERPGRYRLQVRSHRALPAALPTGLLPPVIFSNELAIEILPPGPPLNTEQLAASAPRVLRFLDSPESALEMARRLLHSVGEGNRIGTDDFEYVQGLLATPHREFAAAEMEQLLAHATAHVSPSFVDTLARLRALLDQPVAHGADPSSSEARVTSTARHEAFLLALDRYSAAALEAGRRGTRRDRALALAHTMERLGLWGARAATGRRSQTVTRASVAAELPELFGSLPDDAQYSILAYHWRWIAGPQMLPALQAALRVPTKSSFPRLDVLLTRLAELAPDEAGRIALEEVENPSGRFGGEAVALALERAGTGTSALDALLARRLATVGDGASDVVDCDTARAPCLPWAPLETVFRVVERHGSAALAPDVLRAYTASANIACVADATALAYLMRTVPEVGERLFDALMSERQRRGCYQLLLEEVARIRPVPELEPVALARLGDADPIVAASAARALALVGTNPGREALWRRLETWHREWNGRPEVHAPSQLGPDPHGPHLMLGHALRDALLGGVNWRMTHSDISRLEGLCLDDGCRQGLRVHQPSTFQPVEVTAQQDAGGLRFTIGASWLSSIDSVKQKMAQYQEGTVFTWTASDSISEAVEATLFGELQAFAGGRGLSVVITRNPSRRARRLRGASRLGGL